MTVESDKKTLVKDAMAALEKQFGRGAIMRLGEQRAVQGVDVLPSGIASVDLALGVGGWPRGRIIEIFGPESSGKTTLALQAIAEAHKVGKTCAFLDVEHALDVTYAETLGVQPDKLLVSQPDCGEQALDICDALVRSGAVDLVVVDSVAALVPRAEIEGEMGDAHMGLQARLMSQAMRKLTGVAHRTGCTLLFINQLRQKIGVVFGNPEVTTGGNALKFYASVRVDVRRTGALKDGGDVVGNRTRVKVVKNKLAPPFKEVQLDMVYGQGFSWAADLIDRAQETGLITASGSWLSWGDERLGQGRAAVRKRVESEPELASRLRSALLASDSSAANDNTPAPKPAAGTKRKEAKADAPAAVAA